MRTTYATTARALLLKIQLLCDDARLTDPDAQVRDDGAALAAVRRLAEALGVELVEEGDGGGG